MDSDVPVRAASNGALGAGASLEYRLHRWVALGVDALHARPDSSSAVDNRGIPREHVGSMRR